MAWTTTLVNRLRLIIGDDGATEDYTDLTLSQYIAIAAIDVVVSVNLNITFTIDTDVPTISPDPVTNSSVPEGIGNLFVLKAACKIAMRELRKDSAKYGIKIRDDKSYYDGTEASKNLKIRYDNYCKMYEATRWMWEKGNLSAGKSILNNVNISEGGVFNLGDSSYLGEGGYFHS